jgi:uncharacterized protein YceK
MKNFLLYLTMTVLLSGCAQCWRSVDLETTGWAQVCINGVTYYQFRSGAFVGYNPDGSIKKCAV